MIASNGVEAKQVYISLTCSLLLVFTVKKIYYVEQMLSKLLQTLSVVVYVTILCLLTKALTKSMCIFSPSGPREPLSIKVFTSFELPVPSCAPLTPKKGQC